MPILKGRQLNGVSTSYHENLHGVQKSAETYYLCELVLGEINDFMDKLRDELRPEFEEAVRSWGSRLISRENNVDGYAVVAKNARWSGGAVKT